MLRRHAHRPTVTLSRVPQDARPHRICCSGRRRKEKAAHSPRPYGNCTAGAALRSQMHACRPRKICTPHFFFFTDRGMLGACGGFSGARYEFTLASPSFFLFPALPCPRRFQLSLLHGECHCCTGVYAGAYTLLVNDEGCAVLPNYVGGLVLHQDIGRLLCVCVCAPAWQYTAQAQVRIARICWGWVFSQCGAASRSTFPTIVPVPSENGQARLRDCVPFG